MDNANERFYLARIADEDKAVVWNNIQTITGGTVLIWMTGDEVEEYRISAFNTVKHIITIKCGLEIWSMFKQSKYENKEVMLKITLDKHIYFTTSVMNTNSEESYQLELKENIYQALQRNSFRLATSNSRKVKLRIISDDPEKTITNDCLDISLSGTSFYVDKNDQDKYQIGAKFVGCILLFNSISFSIPEITVVRVIPVEDDASKLFIGIKFVNVPGSVERKLFHEINNEIRMDMIMKRK